MHRLATFALLSLVLGLTGPAYLHAQDDAKKDAAPAETKKDDAAKPAETKKDDAAKPAETKKDDAAKPAESKKDDAAKPAESKPEEPKEAPLPSIPPDVEAKLEKARRAVAEAIVAAQDAGLVETTVNPPPILDILMTGRAIDARQIKKRSGVSPEVFAAWFTGYGKLEGFSAQKDIRIVNPSDGLTEMYTQRANILDRHIKAVREAKDGDEAKKKAEAEAKKKAEDEKMKADAEAKKKAEADAKKKAEEEKMKADAEAKKKAEADAKKKADEEAKKKAEEEAKKKAEADAKKKADEEAKKKADDDAKKKADDDAAKADDTKKDDTDK